MRPLSASLLGLAALVLAYQLTCEPSLGDVGDPVAQLDLALDAGEGGSGGSSGGGGLAITVEPAAPLTAAPPVLRLHASLPGWTFDPTRVALVTGVITTREITELAENKVSATLAARLVPIVSWSEGAGEALAPTVILELGATYSMVMADVPAAIQLTTTSTDATPTLARVWPPAGGSGTASLAIWCGASPTARIDDLVTTAPSDAPGRLQSRIIDGGAGERCVRFDALPTLGASPPPLAVPPPFVASAGRLDPRPIQIDQTVVEPLAALCKAGELRFGPACATVLDDRILARSPPVPALWAIAGSGIDFVLAAAANDPFVVSGLVPSSSIALDVVALDAAGRTSRTAFTATTSAPSPHIAINEVYAWPLGTSPAEEWVEIVNDGLAPAVLDGFVLLVGDQPTAIPSATLAPGAFALLVAAAFVADDSVDPTPASAAAIWSVPHLGREGLSKAGESFTLLDGNGSTISSFPATPKPKAGQSVARVTPSAPDGLTSSFGLAVPTPGAPNQLSQ